MARSSTPRRDRARTLSSNDAGVREAAGPADPVRQSSGWGTVLAIAGAATLVVVVFVLAFTWPTKTSEAKNLPVSVTGPAPVVEQFESTLQEAAPGTFDLVAAADRGEAEQQIRERETYGAFVLAAPPQQPEVLTAPAANTAAAQMLSGVAQQLQAQLQAQSGDPQLTVEVTEVVPLSQDDPNGAGLAVASFPLVLGGMIGGVLISLQVKGPRKRVVSGLVYSVLVGLGLTLIMNTWFGYVQGDFLLDWLGFSVSAGATAIFIIGCVAVLGPPGIGLGALLTMLLGNPLSGANAPWQFLAEPWGLIGQHMVPGASITLLRSLSYFPDAPTAAQWWTLLAWLGAGIVLTLVGHAGQRTTRDRNTGARETDDQTAADAPAPARTHPAH